MSLLHLSLLLGLGLSVVRLGQWECGRGGWVGMGQNGE